MQKSKQIFALRHVVSSIFLLLTLAWLTVCLPVVNENQQKAKAQAEQTDKEPNADDDNPLNNTTEEKTESGISLLDEYIHDTHILEQHFIVLSSSFKYHPSDLYLAYHPDLIIPPPEA